MGTPLPAAPSQRPNNEPYGHPLLSVKPSENMAFAQGGRESSVSPDVILGPGPARCVEPGRIAPHPRVRAPDVEGQNPPPTATSAWTYARCVISIEDVRAAAAQLAGVAHRTPVFTSRTLDELIGATVFR